MSTRDVGLTESRSSGGAGLAGAGARTMVEAIRKTVLVDFTPEEAFDLFAARIASWWPVRTHSYGGDEVKDVVLEPRVGGRLYEVTAAGEQDWGSVLAWEPPRRLLLDWQIGEASGTEVEVTFEPEGPGARVVLEHRGFGASDPRERYSSGWDVVLATYAESTSKNA
jgi:uncharacterized protein YndB with AHSA1/START domain